MKSPIFHAAAALLYIGAVASLVTSIERMALPEPPPMLAVMFFLSLFTLSAAVMGYLFCSRPAMLLIAGEKAEAMRFFFATLGYFALFVLVFALTLFLTI